MDFDRRCNLGYAFLSLISHAEALRFKTAFHGFSAWPGHTSQKVAQVQWSVAGKDAEDYVARYRNSPVMHESIPDECRPLLLQGGVPVAFPAPTRPLVQPKKVRRAKTQAKARTEA